MKTKLKTTLALFAAFCGLQLFTATPALAETDENGLTPKHWYKFNGNLNSSGETALTFKGDTASSYVTSVKDGQAYKYKKDSSGTSYPYGSGMDRGSGDFTIVTVAKTVNLDHGIIWTLGKNNTDSGMALVANGSDKVAFRVLGSWGPSDLCTATVSDATSAYHVYTLTYVNDTKTFSLYVDNNATPAASGAISSVASSLSDKTFQFGGMYGGETGTGANLVKGTGIEIDDYRLYQQVLTTAQIANIYKTFEPITGAARIGNVGYETVAAAFAAVQDGQTVVLLAACTETLTAPAKTFTLDLSGFAMSGSLATVDNSNITLTYGTGGSFTSSVTGGGTIVMPNNTLPTGDFKTSLAAAANWTGTLWIKNKTSWTSWDFENYGNANSKLKLTGVTGYAPNSAKTCNVEIVLADDGDTKALTITDGYSGGSYAYTIAKLSGSGTWKSTTVAAQNYVVTDWSAFTGNFNLTTGTVIVFGTTYVVTGKGSGGVVHIESGKTATIASGATWASSGAGLVINGTLTNNGTITLTSNAKVKGSGTLVYSGVSSAPSALTGLTTASDWTGTVWIKNFQIGGAVLNNYGNANSKVRLTGVNGYLNVDNLETTVPIELVNGEGDVRALDVTDGSANKTYQLDKITGNGSINVSSRNSDAFVVQIKDVTEHTGKITSLDSQTTWSAATTGFPIYIGNTGTPTQGTSSKITVAAGTQINSDCGWEAAAVEFGATLTVKGNVNDVIVSGVTTAPTLNTTVTLLDPTTGTQVAGSYKLEYDSVNHQVKVVDAIIYLGWNGTAWTNGVGTVVTTITTDHVLVAKDGDNITFGAATTPGSFTMPTAGTVTITGQNNLTVSAIDIPTGATLAIASNATPGFGVTGSGTLAYGAGSQVDANEVTAAQLAGFTGTFSITSGRHEYSAALPDAVTLRVADGAQFYLKGGTWNNAFEVSGRGWKTSGNDVELAAIRMDGATLGTSGSMAFSVVNEKIPTLGSTGTGTINGTLTGVGFEQHGNGSIVLGKPKTQATGLTSNIVVANGTLKVGNGNNSGCSAGDEVTIGTGITVNSGATVDAWCWQTVAQSALTTDKVNIMSPITLNGGTLNSHDGGHAFMGAVTVNGTASGTFGYHKGWAFNNLIIPAGSTFNATCSTDGSFKAYFSVLGGDVKGALNVTNGGGKEMRVCVVDGTLADGALGITANNGSSAYVFVLGNVTLGTLTGNAAAIFGDNTATYTLTLKGGTIGSVIKDCEQGVSAEHPLSVIVAGDVTFSGANTYTGTTTVNSGTLKLTGDTIGTGNYTIAGGTLDVRTHRSVPVASIAEGATLSVKQASSSSEVHTISITGTSLTDGDYASKVQVVSAEDEATLLTIETATVTSGTLTIQLAGGTAEAEITGSTTWSALWSGKPSPGASTTVNLTVSSSATLTIDDEVHIAELNVTSVDGNKLTIAFAADSSLHATVYDFSNAAGKVAFDCTGMTAPKTLISGTIEGYTNIDTAGSTVPTGTHLYVDATGVYLAADVYQKFVNNPAVLTFAGTGSSSASAENFHLGPFNPFDINKGVPTGQSFPGNTSTTEFPGWEGTSITPWKVFASNQTGYRAPGYVLRFASDTGTAGGMDASFNPMDVGGMLVETGATGWYFNSNKQDSARPLNLGDKRTTDAVATWFVFNEDFTFSRYSYGKYQNETIITLYGEINFEIASGKTVALNNDTTKGCPNPQLDTTTSAQLKMHGAGTLAANLNATGGVTLDYSDLPADRATPYISGTLTIDNDTIINLPAGLAAGTPFPMATALSGANDGVRTIYIGGEESRKMVTFKAESGTITYADITIYKAEVSGDTAWSAISWSPDPQGAFPTTAELIITNTGNSATITMNADVTVAELLLVSASEKETTFAAGGGAVSIGTYEFSEAAGKVTVGFSTGAASVTAGSDTVLAEAGTDGGSITVNSGMKATVPAWYFDHRTVSAGGYLKFTGDVGSKTLATDGGIPSAGATVEIAGTASIAADSAFASGTANTKIKVTGTVTTTSDNEEIKLANNANSIFEVADGELILQDRVMVQQKTAGTLILSGGKIRGNGDDGYLYPGGGWSQGSMALNITGGEFLAAFRPLATQLSFQGKVNVSGGVFAPEKLWTNGATTDDTATPRSGSNFAVNMTGGTFNVPAGVPNWLPINVNGSATIGVQTGVTAPIIYATITVAADQTATFNIPEGTTLEAKSLAGSGTFAISGAGTLDIGTNRDITINGGNVAVTLTDEDAKIGGVAKVMFTGTATITKVMYGGQDITSKCDISGGSVTIKTSECEATVGTTYYVALATAIGEATDGSTITLLKDAALASAVTLNNSATLVGGTNTISGAGINVAADKSLGIATGFIGVDLGGEGSFNLTGGFYKNDTPDPASDHRYVALSVQPYQGCYYEIVAGSTPSAEDEKVYTAGDEGTIIVSKNDLVTKKYITQEQDVQTFLNGTGANSITNWQNVVLNLSATDATSIPVVAPQQSAPNGKIDFKLGGVTVDTASGATVTYKVQSANTPGAKTWDDETEYLPYTSTATIDLEGSGVKYYRFDVLVTPAK